jgi:predicted acyl esterase
VPESASPVDTARFVSDALTSPLNVVGAPAVRVPVSTTATRVAQMAAKVWDVDQTGAATLVWRGCRSFEDFRRDAEPSFALTLWPNAHTFLPGHRVLLTLSAVDFPTFKPDTEPQQTTILSGAYLDLPSVLTD